MPLIAGASRYTEDDRKKPRLEVAAGRAVSNDAGGETIPNAGTAATILPPDIANMADMSTWGLLRLQRLLMMEGCPVDAVILNSAGIKDEKSKST